MASVRPASPSDSLDSPILIYPIASSSGSATPHTQPPPRLKYPYPLFLLAFLDVGYTAHAYATCPSDVAVYLLVLSVVRGLVLSLVLGGSRRWRFRGGWVGACSVLSLGSVVWEICKGQLLRNGTGNNDQNEEAAGVITWFLILVSSRLRSTGIS